MKPGLLETLGERGLLLATNNANKVRELRRLLTPHSIGVVAPRDIGLTLDVDETEPTIEGNARLKAEAATRATGRPALADDSGLVVDALDGAPGVHSARYGGPGLDDVGRYQLLLRELEEIPLEERSARFVCVLAYADQDDEPLFFSGVVEGRIAFFPAGSGGFGYDPIFIEKDSGKHMAELTAEEKNAISHRGKALRGFLAMLFG